MVNANDKGNRGENAVCTYLNVLGLSAERLRLAGVQDKGDIWVPSFGVPHRLQVKNVAMKNLQPTMSEVVRYLDELSSRFPTDVCAGVIAREAKSVKDWYYVRTMGQVFGVPEW